VFIPAIVTKQSTLHTEESKGLVALVGRVVSGTSEKHQRVKTLLRQDFTALDAYHRRVQTDEGREGGGAIRRQGCELQFTVDIGTRI